MKKVICSIILLVLISKIFLPSIAHADAFVFHLFYNTTKKSLNFDSAFPEQVVYDKNAYVSAVEFSKNNTSGPYTLAIYDTKNNEVVSTMFNKKDGAFSLNIPYFSIGYSLKIFETTSKKEILNADLSKFNTCNGNDICEFEKGENAIGCIGDCASSHVIYSDQTKKVLSENNGVLKDSETGQILLKDKTAITSTQSNQSNQILPSKTSTNNQSATTTSPTSGIETSTSSRLLILIGIALIATATGIIIYKKRRTNGKS